MSNQCTEFSSLPSITKATQPFTGAYPWGGFIVQPLSAGTYTLQIADLGRYDVGKVTAFSITTIKKPSGA